MGEGGQSPILRHPTFSSRFRGTIRIASCLYFKNLTMNVRYGDCVIPVAASRAWNSMPQRVRAAPSIVSFQRLLKTYLFSKIIFCFLTRHGGSEVVLQQQCDSAALIKFIFNNNNNNNKGPALDLAWSEP